MGQKVNPHGLRVGVISDWDSNWFAEDKFADYLVEDYKIREFVKKKLYSAGISKIEIERPTDKVRVIIHTAKPGFVIGKGGAEIENLKKELLKVLDRKVALDIKIMDIRLKFCTDFLWNTFVFIRKVDAFKVQGRKYGIDLSGSARRHKVNTPYILLIFAAAIEHGVQIFVDIVLQFFVVIACDLTETIFDKLKLQYAVNIKIESKERS